jgi:hypothetical protein
MNRIYAVSLATVIALAAAATPAQDHQHAQPQANPGGAPSGGKGMGMMGQGMQEHMKKMHEQMEKIRGTADAGERDKLVQEHMRTMHAAMEAMRGPHGPIMDGRDGSPGAAAGDTQQRSEMMAQCMDMMRKMRPSTAGHGQ